MATSTIKSVTKIDVSSLFTIFDNKIENFSAYKEGNIVYLSGKTKGPLSNPQKLFDGLRPTSTCAVPLIQYSNGKLIEGSVWIQSNAQAYYFGENVSEDGYFSCSYITQS